MAEKFTCVICEADFRRGALKDDKCLTCTTLYPKARNKKEAQAAHQPPNKMGDELDDLKVRDIVAEMLDQRFLPLLEKLDKVLAPAPAVAAPGESFGPTPEVKRGPGRPKKVKEAD